jgi:DNA polymerase III subunit delta
MKQLRLVLSDDEFLASEAVQKLRDDLAEDGFEVEERSARDGLDLTYALSTPSLLGSGRAIIVRDADDLTTDALKEIAAWAASPPPGIVLVLAGSAPKLRKSLSAVAAVSELKAVRFREAEWVVNRARSKGRSMTREAASTLIDAVGVDLRDLATALDQLTVASGDSIDVAAVTDQFRGLEPEVWSFVDSILDRDRSAPMKLRALLDRGENAIGLVATIANQLRLVAFVRGAERKPAAALARELGVKEGKVRRAMRQARNFTPADLARAYRLLAEADMALKGGEWGEDEPNEIVLELLVADLLGGEAVTPRR